MNWIMEIFGIPLGWIMWLVYTVIPNYAIALLLFTVLTKLLLVPLSIKQQKSSIKMQIIQPKVQELQTKYKSNPQKMQEELQALYKRENYSMSAGCLPMLIQFPILFGLIDVVYKPLSHIVRVPGDVITQIKTICEGLGVTLQPYAPQLDMFNAVKANPDAFSAIGTEMINKISALDMTMNLGFASVDLTTTPSMDFGVLSQNGFFSPIGLSFIVLLLVPVLSGLTAFLMSWISMRNNPSSAQMGGSMKVMMYMMPLMSLWFTFAVPVGVGLYWIFSNIFGCFQTVILNKYWNPKEMAEKMRAEDEARREQERVEKIEAKKLAKEKGEVVDEKALSQKEKDRQKLAEARRRNAERYGDYSEDTGVSDNDLKA